MSDTDPDRRPRTEQDAPPTLRIFGMMALLTLAVVVIVFGLYKAFTFMVREQIYKRQLSQPSKELLEQRALDRQRLSQYDLIDPKLGTYQIPIDRAMDKLLKNKELFDIPTTQPARGQPAPIKKGS